jgi:hypothetical protein
MSLDFHNGGLIGAAPDDPGLSSFILPFSPEISASAKMQDRQASDCHGNHRMRRERELAMPKYIRMRLSRKLKIPRPAQPAKLRTFALVCETIEFGAEQNSRRSRF